MFIQEEQKTKKRKITIQCPYCNSHQFEYRYMEKIKPDLYKEKVRCEKCLSEYSILTSMGKVVDIEKN